MTRPLIRWTPSTEIKTRFDRFFDQAFDDLLPAFKASDGATKSWLPVVDIAEDPETITLHVELPGVPKEGVEVAVENSVLTISGERKFEHTAEGKNYHRIERAYGNFQRSFTLPQNVQTDKVAASFADGVLTVTVPKVEEAKARKIDIS